MAGEKLSNAKQAVIECLKHLGPTDTFTLLTFGGNIQFVINEQRMDEASKSHAISLLSPIDANNGTPLHGALRAAREKIEQGLESKGQVLKVILLTDGLPGDVDPTKDLKRYTEISSALRTLGATLVILPIGEDYNNEFLLKMYQAHEGGFYRYVERVESLPSIFEEIFRDSKNVVLPAAKVDVKSTRGVAIRKVYKLSPQVQELSVGQSPDGIQFLQLGDLTAGENQELCIQAEVPARPVGEFREMSFTIPGLEGGLSAAAVVNRTEDAGLVRSRFDPIPEARFREARDKLLVINHDNPAALAELKKTILRYREDPGRMANLTPGHVEELESVVHYTELRGKGSPEDNKKNETELRKSESRATSLRKREQ
jgi:hypothetical protein